MKKITALLLAVLIAAAVGCTGGNGGNNGGPVPAKAEPGKYTDYAEVGGFRLNALAFSGTRTGTETGVNGRSGKDGLRFVFELGEWIDFRLDYEYGGSSRTGKTCSITAIFTKTARTRSSANTSCRMRPIPTRLRTAFRSSRTRRRRGITTSSSPSTIK